MSMQFEIVVNYSICPFALEKSILKVNFKVSFDYIFFLDVYINSKLELGGSDTLLVTC